MIMLLVKLTGEVLSPRYTVTVLRVIQSVIRCQKSPENVIDPVDIIKGIELQA